MTTAKIGAHTRRDELLLDDLRPVQRDAVEHDTGPLLIVAGAGTGKTTVITRRIAWLIATERAKPEEILALTFTEKSASEMQERVDLLLPYGYVDVLIKTFHAFGDQLIREYALNLGISPEARVLSKSEQLVFLRRHVFDLPLGSYRPLHDPGRFLEAMSTLIARAKDEAVSPEEFIAVAQAEVKNATGLSLQEAKPASRLLDIAQSYAAYQKLLRNSDLMDFGDQVLLAVKLLEGHRDILVAVRDRFRYILVDEFQDTNYAQFRMLQLLADPCANVNVVADDDQSIYQWRGAAISNVVKFLEHYRNVRTLVITENFRSTQTILECAYRLIRFNDPDRLEVRQGIDKRLRARTKGSNEDVRFRMFDTISTEADWVASTIRQAIESGQNRPGDIAILVRSNREADIFLRALNVAGVPWQFSGASGLFAREESKMLISCLRALADPQDTMSWYHVASSLLYNVAMGDLVKVMAKARRNNLSLRAVLEELRAGSVQEELKLSESSKRRLLQLSADVELLLELSKTHSAGELLYRWLWERGFLASMGRMQGLEDVFRLQTVGRFFEMLGRMEDLVGRGLPELMEHLQLFQALGEEPLEEDDVWADRVSVLTVHKAKGLEFPVVFLVGLVQGRFPTARRRDAIELPDSLIKDILPSGDYRLQEERRLFYVGMTRAKKKLYLSASYNCGGKTQRKVSQFVMEALNLASQNPVARVASARELIERHRVLEPLPLKSTKESNKGLRLDPHGVDDYLTCPLKYKYSHVVNIPVMRHHLVVYGSALHKSVEAFFKRQLQGRAMSEPELLEVFERNWHSEGFLTREHEKMRLEQGRNTLKGFYEQQMRSPEHPTLIEESFKVQIGSLRLVGRWDRVDRRKGGAVIIDYKSSDVADEREANERTKKSIQMLLYALAWREIYGKPPARLELRFLETGQTGRLEVTDEVLSLAEKKLQEAARGVQAREFGARPKEHTCRWCAFQAICSFAFRTG